jgi:hypothetical protein
LSLVNPFTLFDEAWRILRNVTLNHYSAFK